jgi:hypothetical protein
VDFRPTLRERKRCTILPVLQSATMRSILPYICPWLKEGRDRLQRRLLEAYVNSAFVTHTQFRPAPQWPNILMQSGVSYYQVPTSLWEPIQLTKKDSKDIAPMHFFKPSRKMNLYIISQTSFRATWREENFDFTLKVEGQKPGTEPSENGAPTGYL